MKNFLSEYDGTTAKVISSVPYLGFPSFINDLLGSNLGSLDSKTQVYADDVLLYKTITSPSDRLTAVTRQLPKPQSQ